MQLKGSNLPIWMVTNAWREIFARIFERVETQLNASPEWLVNPETHRHLKLDILYPKIGMAVRFEGLQGKHRKRRLSLLRDLSCFMESFRKRPFDFAVFCSGGEAFDFNKLGGN